MPIENPYLHREPPAPNAPKDNMSEATWKRVNAQMLRIRHPEWSLKKLAREAGLSELEADRFLNQAMNDRDL